ncbi:MAG TPA: hypothetical protein VGJ26_02680 [Pirellulales bacterium]|jgi:Cft2 family RNA processing exonuclease
MFHYDRGLKLTRADLAVDFCRRQPRGFISHAHHDHMARHELALCTPQTARLYHLRLGKRPVLELPYRQPLDWGGMRLTTYPAGHCLGSAMLLAEQEGKRLLYTGDFKLDESATAERAELPRADILVIESTFGRPEHRHMPRAEAISQLIGLVREVISAGRTAVVHAYALGKAQEVTRLLTCAGVRVLQHAEVFEVSQVYQQCGVDLGEFELHRGQCAEGCALVVPPRRHAAGDLARIRSSVTFAVTGWAGDGAARHRLGVDHGIPLSDHADFDDLLSAVAQVDPSVVYCTHGPASFVEHVRAAGYTAFPLDGKALLFK